MPPLTSMAESLAMTILWYWRQRPNFPDLPPKDLLQKSVQELLNLIDELSEKWEDPMFNLRTVCLSCSYLEDRGIGRLEGPQEKAFNGINFIFFRSYRPDADQTDVMWQYPGWDANTGEECQVPTADTRNCAVDVTMTLAGLMRLGICKADQLPLPQLRALSAPARLLRNAVSKDRRTLTPATLDFYRDTLAVRVREALQLPEDRHLSVLKVMEVAFEGASCVTFHTVGGFSCSACQLIRRERIHPKTLSALTITFETINSLPPGCSLGRLIARTFEPLEVSNARNCPEPACGQPGICKVMMIVDRPPLYLRVARQMRLDDDTLKSFTLPYASTRNEPLTADYQWRGVVAFPGDNHFSLYWEGDDGHIMLYDGMRTPPVSHVTRASLLAGRMKVCLVIYKLRLGAI